MFYLVLLLYDHYFYTFYIYQYYGFIPVVCVYIYIYFFFLLLFFCFYCSREAAMHVNRILIVCFYVATCIG